MEICPRNMTDYNSGSCSNDYKKENNIQLMKTISTMPVIATLNDLIKELHRVFESDSVNIEYVSYVMKSYKSNPAEWRRFAKFDRYRYTRNLVDEGNGKFNLMILCWGESHGSAIHDHANSHCFMKMLQGELEEVRYAWPIKTSTKSCQTSNEGIQCDIGQDFKSDELDGEPMFEISRNKLDLNSVCYINDSLGLHRVENPSHINTSVSLHLYCPPFDSCRVFNQTTGKSSKCSVTFWSKFGEKRNRDIQAQRMPEDN